MTEFCVVLSTAASAEEGIGLGRKLVEERLAACVNVLPGARSVYVWQGEMQESDEAVLLIKTRSDRYADLARRIQELHSYAVPEIVAVPIEAGSRKYLEWVAESVAEAATERGGERSP